MTESHLEKKLIKMCAEKGVLCYKFVSPGRTGVPDRIVVFPGGLVAFVELKTKDGKLSARQAACIDELTEMGAVVRVLRPAGFVDFGKWIDSVKALKQ